jgi:hypothetical protein
MQPFWVVGALILSLVLSSACVSIPGSSAASGRTYHVDGAATNAADTNPGTIGPCAAQASANEWCLRTAGSNSPTSAG